MGLLPPGGHHGQRRLRQVPALSALRPQSALLGKSVPGQRQVGTAGRRFLPTADTEFAEGHGYALINFMGSHPLVFQRSKF